MQILLTWASLNISYLLGYTATWLRLWWTTFRNGTSNGTIRPMRSTQIPLWVLLLVSLCIIFLPIEEGSHLLPPQPYKSVMKIKTWDCWVLRCCISSLLWFCPISKIHTISLQQGTSFFTFFKELPVKTSSGRDFWHPVHLGEFLHLNIEGESWTQEPWGDWDCGMGTLHQDNWDVPWRNAFALKIHPKIINMLCFV